jgi:hypothetical protein
MMATYKVLTGLDYGKPSKRAEAGEVVSFLQMPPLLGLLEQKLLNYQKLHRQENKSKRRG